MTDIHKAGGVIVRDGKLLVTRSKGKSFFVAPGGKLEAGETARQALVRELKEELNIVVAEADLTDFGTFHAEVIKEPGRQIQMDVFTVTGWAGEITPSHEIEEVRWVDSNLPHDMELGSIFHHEVLPRLKEQGFVG
jgi:8-oxo-dGTP diphosphatase